MKAQFWIIIVLVVAAFAYWVGSSQRSQANYKVVATPSISPTTSFSLKQQCSDDAYKFANNMQQIANKDWEIASRYHSGNTTEKLNGSAFSPELNTCVAEVDTSIVQDNVVSSSNVIYDTINGKTLAQCLISSDGSCGKYSFINTYPHGYNQNPNWADWSNYRNSIGL